MRAGLRQIGFSQRVFRWAARSLWPVPSLLTEPQQRRDPSGAAKPAAAFLSFSLFFLARSHLSETSVINFCASVKSSRQKLQLKINAVTVSMAAQMWDIEPLQPWSRPLFRLFHRSVPPGDWCFTWRQMSHLETDVPPGDRCSDWAVFAFQGGVLWGVHGRGEEDPEVSGHQVYPEDGFKRQGEQRRERDRRSAKVRQITDYRLQACMWFDLKFYTPDFGR